MNVTVRGHAATESGDRYVQQLVKHWSHKFATSYAAGRGEVPFSPDAIAVFTSDAKGLDIVLTTASEAQAERLKGVIESHIDRFAFREAPLAYEWNIAG